MLFDFICVLMLFVVCYFVVSLLFGCVVVLLGRIRLLCVYMR